MPSEEGKQVLALLAEGKIDVDQAYRLLLALGDIGLGAAASREPPARPPGPWATGGSSGGEAPRTGGRILRIRVTEDGEQKVNVAIPLAIALGKFGVDLDELLRTVDFPGKIVDITDDDDRVEIFVE
ncbi:MAG: hypothetical protein E6I20_05800 [Chloroflexi bacterium]|nr:MAG: hypothetical protein E6I20_05800 [Chloroflexota bacterium]